MEVDTGTAIFMISESTFKRLWTDREFMVADKGHRFRHPLVHLPARLTRAAKIIRVRAVTMRAR